MIVSRQLQALHLFSFMAFPNIGQF